MSFACHVKELANPRRFSAFVAEAQKEIASQFRTIFLLK